MGQNARNYPSRQQWDEQKSHKVIDLKLQCWYARTELTKNSIFIRCCSARWNMTRCIRSCLSRMCSSLNETIFICPSVFYSFERTGQTYAPKLIQRGHSHYTYIRAAGDSNSSFRSERMFFLLNPKDMHNRRPRQRPPAIIISFCIYVRVLCAHLMQIEWNDGKFHGHRLNDSLTSMDIIQNQRQTNFTLVVVCRRIGWDL